MAQSLPSPNADGTRHALIAAGIALFGSQGFAATSVRQLAAEAGANIAAIAYHFGGKDGLRLACAEEFGRRMGAAIGAVPASANPGPDEARQEIRTIIRAMAGFVLGAGGASAMVPFMLRELADGGPGIDAVYRNLAEPMHRRLCALWACANGADPDSAGVRLEVFSVIGQIMYFRIGQTVVLRRMGWPDLGPAEVDQIVGTIVRNLDAMLDANGGP